MPFSAGIGLDFCIFLVTYKKLKKFKIYISGEAVHSQTARQRDEKFRERDISQNHQAGPINQVGNDCF